MVKKLALYGGPKAIQSDSEDLFLRNIFTKEDEDAILDVLRRKAMSDIDVTLEFEKKFAEWQGCKYALACNNGTAAVHSAMFACKIGIGDEIISPSITYWASTLPVYSLGATPLFADIDPFTLCIDPKDIEHRITDRTKAIMVVHYVGYPADMNPIMDIAKKYNLKVIEDVSHAQGGLYKGRKLGTIGDVGAISLMSGKSFAIGEGGMLVTNDREIFERSIAFGHHRRFKADEIETEYLKPFAGLPMGGYKYRLHQMSSAVGLVQIKYYDKRCEEIRKAMNYFWDLLEGVPGIRAHRVPENSGSNMAGWYYPQGLYVPEELEGLSVTKFTEAVRAEGVSSCRPAIHNPLHHHALLRTCDVYGHGKPTRIANSKKDIREADKTLPISEKICSRTYKVPWFWKYRPKLIEEYAKAFYKVSKNYKELLKDDPGNPPELKGEWYSSLSN